MLRALGEDATNVAAVVLRARLARDDQERLALARDLVKARPDAGEGWSLLGRALEATNAPIPEREAAFLKAVALDPKLGDPAQVADILAPFADRGATVVPCAIVGSEEASPGIARTGWLADLLGITRKALWEKRKRWQLRRDGK